MRHQCRKSARRRTDDPAPVTAHVVLKVGTEVEVRAASRVIVAPPDFAPNTRNLVTLPRMTPFRSPGTFTRSLPQSVVTSGSMHYHCEGMAEAAAVISYLRHHWRNCRRTLLPVADLRRIIFERIRNPAPPDNTTAEAQSQLFLYAAIRRR